MGSEREIRVTDGQLNEHPYLLLLNATTPRLLGATSLEEQAFCRWYGAHGLVGNGVVVELGPWLGSLTISTARGLAANGSVARARRIIHAFDLFLWDAGFDGWVAGTPQEGRYRPGETFLPLYREWLAPYGNDATVIAHQEDLAQASWPGEPIEFLINDAWKRLPIMANVVERFFPALAAGAVVFHQDYLWSSDSFIHVGMYRLRDYFRFVCRIQNSCTALFRKVREIPSSVLAEMASRRSYADFTEAEVHAAFDWSKALFADPEARLVVDAGRAWMLLQMGNSGAARQIFAEIKRSSHYQHPFYRFQEGVLRQWGLGNVIGGD
jgi:hypothetical protein